MAAKNNKYIEMIGRRKTATARVRLAEASKDRVTVNEKPFATYFVTKEQQATALRPLTELKDTGAITGSFDVTVRVAGSGVASQAGAVAHGLARALVGFNTDLRGELKRAGLLTRDARMKERRKFGLKKARKAPQWSKR